MNHSYGNERDFMERSHSRGSGYRVSQGLMHSKSHQKMFSPQINKNSARMSPRRRGETFQ